MTVTYEPNKEYKAPTETELINKALVFMKENYSRKKYKALKDSGEVQELAQLKAKAAIRYAENLISSGMWAGEAWNQAIRLEILESESD